MLLFGKFVQYLCQQSRRVSPVCHVFVMRFVAWCVVVMSVRLIAWRGKLETPELVYEVEDERVRSFASGEQDGGHVALMISASWSA